MKRIRRLLYPTSLTFSWTPIFAIAVLLTTVAITLNAWPSSELAPHRDTQSALLANPTADTTYHRWLTEDVVYIIDDAERAAFLKLTADAERDRFVAQFWERRNPAPGSPENKFKIEHYRRIAYANKHYPATSGAAGWQSDRGHMYILYGPPDEIDSHPKGIPHPWDCWGYRNVEQGSDLSYFRFVDVHGTGDYRLAPSVGR